MVNANDGLSLPPQGAILPPDLLTPGIAAPEKGVEARYLSSFLGKWGAWGRPVNVATAAVRSL